MTSLDVRGQHGSYSVGPSPFASGGQAKVFSVTGAVGLVYKRFDVPLTDQTDIRRLGRLTTEGRRVFLTDRQVLGQTPQSSILWPVDLVPGERSSVAGIVMPRIPAPYFHVGGPARDLQWLFLRKTDPPPVAPRMAILIRFAEVMSWLRERDLVHGDLNQNNLVWTIEPRPSGILIDTDGIHSSTTGLRHGVQTPFWTDPRRSAGEIVQHDVHSDAYLLGLAVYRTLYLTPGNLARRPDGSFMKAQIRPGTPDRLGRMLHSALNDPLAPLTRPEPKEWVEALLATFFPNGKVSAKNVASVERINLAESGTSGRSGANSRPGAVKTPAPFITRSAPPRSSSPPMSASQPAPLSLVMLDATRAWRRLLTYTSVLAIVFGVLGTVSHQKPGQLSPWQIWGSEASGDTIARILMISFASGMLMLLIDTFVAAKHQLRSGAFSPLPLHLLGAAIWIGGWIAVWRTHSTKGFLDFLTNDVHFDVRSTAVAGVVAAHVVAATRDIIRSRAGLLFGWFLASVLPFAFGIVIGRFDLQPFRF